MTKKKRKKADHASEQLKPLNRKAHGKGSSENLAQMDRMDSFLPQLVGGKSVLEESDVRNIFGALPIHQQIYDWCAIVGVTVQCSC